MDLKALANVASASVEPRILTGPVVGKVTAHSARVLLECERDAIVVGCADDRMGGRHEVEVELRRHRPGIFHFDGLRDGTPYTVTFKGANGGRNATFKTLSPGDARFKLLCVSCNDTAAAPGIWPVAAEHVRSGAVQFVLHLGDQIYADEAFRIGMKTFDRQRAPQWEEETRDLFRDVYRRTWTAGAVAEVLANCSNLMVWDDHDIRDNWSEKEQLRRPALYQRVLKLGKDVYREYQRQLWDDGTALASDGYREFHAHRFGNMGVIFLDQRGGREDASVCAEPYLGTVQWTQLRRLLITDTSFSSVSVLVVAMALPLVLLSERLTRFASVLIPDVRDQWSYSPYRGERLQILSLLKDWQSARSDRRVILVTGDAHVGVVSDICYEEKPLFRQVISSPVSSAPLHPWLSRFLQSASRGRVGLGGGFSYQHNRWETRRNFAVVEIAEDLNIAQIAG